MRKPEEILFELLNKRGINTPEDIAEFLSDKPKKTYDPFLLLNMKEGVDLLLNEIKDGTKICIYGDYDADGVTSVCILSHVLSMLTDNFTYYIPSRFEEGYGLNKDAIDKLKADGTCLIITVDCGSVSFDEVEYAKSIGLKMIVTDHHSIDDIKADCILINPKQKECTYPFRELAGCGVAFKMAQAIQQTAGLPKSAVNDVLDLVAVGTVGDIVSLQDENRTIVKYGLNKINSGSRESLSCLKKVIRLPWVTSENIAFGIAPHINAAGRMAHASEAVAMFRETNPAKMHMLAERLAELNAERKSKQEDAYNECVEMISDEAFILLVMNDIHEGIAGIVAGKIKENFHKPVIILTPSEEGYLKGTGRSIETVDLYKVLKKCSNLFERFGGHKSACGLLMKEEYLEEFRQYLNNEMELLLEENPDLFVKEAQYDIEILPEEITLELADELTKIEPVGQDNPKPVFAVKEVMLNNIAFMGADSTHVRFRVTSKLGNIECVLFKRAQEVKEILFSGLPVNLIGKVNSKAWNGRRNVQFVVEEIMLCE